MAQQTDLDLTEIGRTVAQEVAGDIPVEAVEAEEGADWTGAPAYYFVFLIEEKREQSQHATLRGRIAMRIADRLWALGDRHLVYVRVLGRANWAKRGRAWAR